MAEGHKEESSVAFNDSPSNSPSIESISSIASTGGKGPPSHPSSPINAFRPIRSPTIHDPFMRTVNIMRVAQNMRNKADEAELRLNHLIDLAKKAGGEAQNIRDISAGMSQMAKSVVQTAVEMSQYTSVEDAFEQHSTQLKDIAGLDYKNFMEIVQDDPKKTKVLPETYKILAKIPSPPLHTIPHQEHSAAFRHVPPQSRKDGIMKGSVSKYRHMRQKTPDALASGHGHLDMNRASASNDASSRNADILNHMCVRCKDSVTAMLSGYGSATSLPPVLEHSLELPGMCEAQMLEKTSPSSRPKFWTDKQRKISPKVAEEAEEPGTVQSASRSSINSLDSDIVLEALGVHRTNPITGRPHDPVASVFDAESTDTEDISEADDIQRYREKLRKKLYCPCAVCGESSCNCGSKNNAGNLEAKCCEFRKLTEVVRQSREVPPNHDEHSPRSESVDHTARAISEISICKDSDRADDVPASRLDTAAQPTKFHAHSDQVIHTSSEQVQTDDVPTQFPDDRIHAAFSSPEQNIACDVIQTDRIASANKELHQAQSDITSNFIEVEGTTVLTG